ncbi:hypothetical protein [Streptomyces sp. ISID311]|uniref:hypothetical protein n=1 Tax=Streptomyces sp. ISID311 TaxID=2601673 RepID=UPI0011BD3009|nr:hypothetical protein [Streptomyces sp. ISID311]TXC99956.1 hypothetical protein FS847_01530 [Streptomyces sp. ISID311]
MSRPAPAACRSVLVLAEAGEKVVLVVQVVLDAVRTRPVQRARRQLPIDGLVPEPLWLTRPARSW